jgi:hypothetical protein
VGGLDAIMFASFPNYTEAKIIGYDGVRDFSFSSKNENLENALALAFVI